MLTVLGMSSVSSCDYRFRIDVDGEVKEFFVRRVRDEEVFGTVIGEFEPVRSFRDLPLDIDQYRELMALVAAVHSGDLPPNTGPLKLRVPGLMSTLSA